MVINKNILPHTYNVLLINKIHGWILLRKSVSRQNFPNFMKRDNENNLQSIIKQTNKQDD